MNPIDLIDAQLLQIAAPSRPASELAEWVTPIKQACVKYDMNTVRRIAAFIGQMAHESELRARTENLNYSVAALLTKFGRHRISRFDALRFGRLGGRPANQEAIANAIYGGAWGARHLGNIAPGDGWRWRGSGPLQVTGRANVTRFAASMGLSLAVTEGLIRTLAGGILIAGWFWEANGINRLADTPGVSDESRRINGGVNGLADRKMRFDRVVHAMLKRGA